MKKLPKQEENFPDWYNQVVLEADLADYGPARGTMIIKPYGYAIWERIQLLLDKDIKKAGVQNMYFPMFIPESLLNKEKKHIEGFAPEVAVVTHGGGKKLEEPLIIRPTSETIIYDAFSRWIQSYRDLPLLINQWANVVRWEMRTRLFLRTTEFLWQEGHTAHANRPEAEQEVERALLMYQHLVEDVFAIKVIAGRKTKSETFAGAEYTTCIEGLMRDGKALQMGTSHLIGEHFAKEFGVSFLDETGQKKNVITTSWGVSTRLIGGLIMAHGDDKGLILPPRIAPYEFVVIPIWKTPEERAQIAGVITELSQRWELDNRRVYVDWRETVTPGFKFNDWELKGAPIRIEIGPKDVAQKQAVVVRRDTAEKTTLPLKEIHEKLAELVQSVQQSLLQRHTQFVTEHTHEPKTYEEFKQLAEQVAGFFKAFHCGQADCEAAIKEETKATARVIPFDQPTASERLCLRCSKPAQYQVLFARAY